MKVSIIGGGGLVGSCAAFALQTGKIVREIALLDISADLAEGQALDLMHGSSVMADQSIHAGGYEQIANSDCVCITAGLRRKPDESRLDLINRNVALFNGILEDLKKAGLSQNTVLLVVSNPVDILTFAAAKKLDSAPGKVIGLGTLLDSIRLRSLIAEKLSAPPTQVSALILGEHGDSMVPVWSGATLAGMPLEKHPAWNPRVAGEIFARTKTSGAEAIKKKGGAGFAVGLAIAEVIHAIALDSRRILPVSSPQNGCYGINGVSISVPTVVGRGGILGTCEIELWQKELQGLLNSAEVLRQTLESVKF
jgi:L-lactate dehydrogenase